MQMTTFAIQSGYSQAIIRGFRASFFTSTVYQQIKNCSSLQDLVSILSQTDYGIYISQGDNIKISVPMLRHKLKKKLADQISYAQCNSTGMLPQFLQKLCIRYQIDNVVNYIQGVKNKIDTKLLQSNADPLGYYPQLSNIKVLQGDDYSGLYRDVLIDTPVGPYFMRFLQDQMVRQGGQSRTMTEVQNIFRDMKPQYIRTSLKKLWLQDFYQWCQIHLNPTSQAMMADLLKFQADFKAIQVVYNSIGNRQLNNAAKVQEARKKLCPNLGYLYPDAKPYLMNATTVDQLRQAVRSVGNYSDIVAQSADPTKKQQNQATQKSLDDLMYDQQCKRYALAFDQCNHVAVFYAYIKLKEQQIRNIIWLGQMISRRLTKNHGGWRKYIIPFSHLQQGNR